MRVGMYAIALSMLVAGCSVLSNSGLSGTDYSVMQTITLSGDPVLKADGLVQSTVRQAEGGEIYFETTRSSNLGTGLTTATWENVQGLYLTEEQVSRWASSSSQSRPHLSPEVARALIQCAPALGSHPSLPVAAANATSFGRVTVGDRVYFQYLLSKSEWRTELDQAPGGGGRNVRILPGRMEAFGSALALDAGDTLNLALDVEYRFAGGTTASHRLSSAAIRLDQVRANCDAGGALQISGVPSQPTPSGWLPVALESYNLVTRITEREER